MFIRLMRLLNFSGNSTLDEQQVPPDVVTGDEVISAYVRKKLVYAETGTVKPDVLMPRRFNGRLETSICRTVGLDAAPYWKLCADHYDTKAPSPAIGRGLSKAAVVSDEGLQFDVDGDPHPWHANIIGWPDPPDVPIEERKHLSMRVAQRMAKHFKFEPRPQA
jgi:hypothetical protein